MKKYASEFAGTAFLLTIIVGSGIMGEKLSGGNEAIALLANSIATGAGLFVLIQCLGPISGAHFNPVVSFTEMFWKRLSKKDMTFYWLAQIAGAIAGVFAAHIMFDLPLLQTSTKYRETFSLFFSEFVATFGLLSVIATAGKKHPEWAPLSIASYITAAYWFTSSTSFANPAVTLARSLTNTFAGIAPSGVLPFIASQFVASVTVFLVFGGRPGKQSLGF